MDFTREPIIETVITPKEGCKLVVRSSKSTGQEEYFVDAVEVVSFGHSFFFRSTERPKTFLVPATDYEILEVREARMVLKNVGLDRTIKIGGGREAQMRTAREPVEKPAEMERVAEGSEESLQPSAEASSAEPRMDKKRDRRRQNRRRRGREGGEEEGQEGAAKSETGEGQGERPAGAQVVTTSVLTSLLPPPPTLISETIARYKDNALFKDAFYSKEEQQATEPPVLPIVLEQPEYGSFEVSEDEEEAIYNQRKKNAQENGHANGESHQPHAFEEPFSRGDGDLDSPHSANHEKEDI